MKPYISLREETACQNSIISSCGRRKRTLHLYVVTATNLGLRSSDSEPTQRRRTACNRTWWWWLWALWAVVKSFHMGWWDLENHHRWYPFTITATTLFSYQGTCAIQHGWTAFNNIPRPPTESIDDLSHRRTNECRRTNERANIRPLLTPRAIARGACGHSPFFYYYYLAAWITTHGFPCLLSTEWWPLERA